MNEPQLDDYRWLISPDAEPWLAEAATASGSLVAMTSRLRRSLSAAQTHLVLEQVTLRRRAREKFAVADRMFFTPRGLEQATDQHVARYKAARFPKGAAVADLCCGIGGDLLALAASGPAIGVDRDPVMGVLAQANCAAWQTEGSSPPHPQPLSHAGRGESGGAASPSESPTHSPLSPGGRGVGGEGDTTPKKVTATTNVLTSDVEAFDICTVAAWHIDPDRRPQGRRTTRVELHEPGPEAIDRLRTVRPDGAVKLAPAAILPEEWSQAAEQEWISRAGECRQLVCWFGGLAGAPGQRRATIVDSHGQAARTIIGDEAQSDVEPPLGYNLGHHLYEPDAAVLAAHLTAVLAEEHNLTAITPGVAYLTTDQQILDPALATFTIREVFPFDVRKLRAALAERKTGRLEIKKRGVECEPEKLRRELKLRGDEQATLILMPIAGRPVAILADRLVQPSD